MVITNNDELKTWLCNQSHPTQIAIATRCALRVFPLVVGEIGVANEAEAISLLVERAILTAAVGHKWPTPDVKTAAIAASDFTTVDMPQSPCKFAAIISNMSAVFTAAAEPISASSTDTFITFCTTDLTTISAAEISAVANAAYSDTDIIEVDPFTVDLWHDKGMPVAIQVQWDRFQILATKDSPWAFWREWYQSFLDANPVDWELQKKITLIPDEDWEQGPENIAKRIKVLMAQTEMNKQSHVDVAVEPEGSDNTGSDGWGDYPLDAVFVRTEQRTVSEVVKRITNKRYILDPDFQRDFVWPPVKQSKLIESCIMRIPLPVFYVAEASDGRIIVVDGLQRLTTFARFLNDELKLTGLSSGENAGSHQLERKTFTKLPLNLQERVQDTQLIMYILDSKAPERARLDIFERVNSGEGLTRQQMRNALYNGPGTNWLKSAVEGESFKIATAGSLGSKTMRDREAVNRFAAFFLIGWQNYISSDMDGFLALGLKKLDACTELERKYLRHSFDNAMRLSHQLFGRHAFRKSLVSELAAGDRSVINISLFEVSAVMFARFAESFDSENNATLQHIIADLVKNEVFSRAITYSTNSTQAVKERFSMLETAVGEFL